MFIGAVNNDGCDQHESVAVLYISHLFVPIVLIAGWIVWAVFYRKSRESKRRKFSRLSYAALRRAVELQGTTIDKAILIPRSIILFWMLLSAAAFLVLVLDTGPYRDMHGVEWINDFCGGFGLLCILGIPGLATGIILLISSLIATRIDTLGWITFLLGNWQVLILSLGLACQHRVCEGSAIVAGIVMGIMLSLIGLTWAESDFPLKPDQA
jgi:hypothetical protein